MAKWSHRVWRSVLATILMSATACSPHTAPAPLTPTGRLPTFVSTVTAQPVIAAQPTVGPTVSRPRRIDLDSGLYLRQIDSGVFIVEHEFPWLSNSLLVEMRNSDLVLVGTPYTPEATRTLLKWTASQFGQRKIVAINTGYHVDNLGGNTALIEAGIPIYGSDETVRLLQAQGEDARQTILGMLKEPQYQPYYQAHAALIYDPATQLFPLSQGLDLRFGDEVVQVYFPGPTHAPDNVVVYFPTRKLLFGGCMIVGGAQLGNVEDADLVQWPASLAKLDRFDAEIVVPAHSDRLDRELIEHTRKLVADIR